MNKQLVIGFGEALVDVLPSGEVVGGAPLNFAIRAAELGSRANFQVSLITRIGADARGEKILARLRDTSLDLKAVQVDSQLQSGYVDVTLESGQPSYTIGENVAWDAITFDETVAELALRVRTICFGTLAQRGRQSRDTLLKLLDSAQSAAHREAIKILDINLRRPFPDIGVIENSLVQANILKCNEEELLQLSEWLKLSASGNAVHIAAELQKKFDLQTVFWTRGAAGCRWQDGDQIVDGQVPELDRQTDADTVGAGDAASAALAIGVTAEWSPQKIVDAANLCGAFAANHRGPTEPLTTAVIDRIFS